MLLLLLLLGWPWQHGVRAAALTEPGALAGMLSVFQRQLALLADTNLCHERMQAAACGPSLLESMQGTQPAAGLAAAHLLAVDQLLQVLLAGHLLPPGGQAQLGVAQLSLHPAQVLDHDLHAVRLVLQLQVGPVQRILGGLQRPAGVRPRPACLQQPGWPGPPPTPEPQHLAAATPQI